MNTSTGQQLRQAREARSLTLEQVAQATHMRVHYLEALESGDYSSIPSRAQAKGFLRAYAAYLQLDAEPLLSDFYITAADYDIPPPVRERQPKPAASSLDTGEAGEIFIEIGRTLRGQREILGLSLEDVGRHTHLQQHYLVALEAGNLDGLPSPVQGRGMLANYARFLGLDADQLLLSFADGLQTLHVARQAARGVKPRTASERKPARGAAIRLFLSIDLLVVIAVSVGMIVFVGWGVLRILAMDSDEVVSPTAPSIADVLLASPTASLTFTPEPATATRLPQVAILPTQEITTTVSSETVLPPLTPAQVQIYILVRQRAFLQVKVDGEVEFSGRVLPGNAYNFAGESFVEILTGNAAGLHVYFNQQDMGVLGDIGQVVERMYSVEGVVTATPTITPTPTVTLPATRTPTETPTPRPGQATAPPLP